jgi:hypothetical protein
VISATDDLHAMRAEMEESPTGKRSVGQSSGEKSSASKSPIQPALMVALKPSFATDSAWYQSPSVLTSTATSPAIRRAPRAPPSFSSDTCSQDRSV